MDKTLVSPLKVFNFDWDDNIMFLPTKIIIFHKATGEEVALSTHEFAKFRKEVGISGRYADFEIHSDETKSPFSFREFRDKTSPPENTFYPQVIEALIEDNWQGPSFKAFQDAMAEEKTAAETTIITARGHEPESILAALLVLQEIGFIKHVPAVENIFPVSCPKLKGKASHPSETKAQILLERLDSLNSRGRNVSFGFSDDDHGTYKMVKDLLEAKVKAGHWQNVEIVLYFTGPKPETVVLTKTGAIPLVESSVKAA